MIRHHYIDTSEYTSVKFSSNSDNTLYFNGGSTNVYVGTPDVLYNDFAVIKHIGTYTHGAINSNPNIELDAVPTTDSNNLVNSGNIKKAIDVAPRFYLGTCSTAGNVAIKQVDIPDFPTQLVNGVETPIVGSVIAVKFANDDSNHINAEPGKIKVNNTSAYLVWYNGEENQNQISGSCYGVANRYIYYVFNGTHWVWINHGVDNNTTYAAGAGLKLSSNQFSLNVPRVAKNANSLPGKNTAIFEEYSDGPNYNLPTNAWYHILTMEGSDTNYVTQLALGLTIRAVYYRNYYQGSWQPWKRLDNPTITPQSLGFGYASCTTNATTTTKTATLSGYNLVDGGLVVVYFENDVPAQATLNINSTGAKEIHFGSSRLAAGVIKAGDKCLFVYNGNYMLIAIDRWGKELQEKVSGINISETNFEALSTYEQGKLYFVYDDNNNS